MSSSSFSREKQRKNSSSTTSPTTFTTDDDNNQHKMSDEEEKLFDIQSRPWSKIEILGENADYPGQKNNHIKTTRYNLVTFLPLTLFENFRNLANIFFLTSVVISFLPWSPVSAIFVLVPLLFVLAVSIIKAGVEDLMKRSDDKKWNSQPCKVYRPVDLNGRFEKNWITVKSSELKVGDVLLIEKDSIVPADLLYISSAQSDKLVYYSETSLNGESAVKTMNCFPHFDSYVNNESDSSFKDDITKELLNSKYYIDVSEPDRDLLQYNLRLRKPETSGFWSISIKNILLRGVMTHYTDAFIGVVVRTGHDTKIMKNMKHPPAKMTTFDRNLNRMILVIFFIFLVLCLTSSGVGVAIEQTTSFELVKGAVPKIQAQSFGEYFMQYFIIYSYFIPISMMVTIELIRLFFKIIISFDADLFDPEFGNATEHNSNQIGQLGLITHILSDKTGTLTENVMELQKLNINGQTFDADTFEDDFNSSKMPDKLKEDALNFMLSMAICNNVIVHHPSSHNNNTLNAERKIEYNADSPDEAAFVSYSSRCNVKLISRDLTTMTIEVNGVQKVYEILAVLPFNSDRKRMSILVRCEGESHAILFSKGADNIMQGLTVGYGQKETDLVNSFAIAGLRTLVFANKVMHDSREVEQWLANYRNADSSIEGREEKVAYAAAQIECNLSVVGITGVEDRLQPEVPETITWLRDADLKVWILTGDKLETAVSIGRTTKVILPDSDVIIIGSEDKLEVKQMLESAAREIENMMNPVLIVSGISVDICINDYIEEFLDLANKSMSVILSRVSPFMKAQATLAVKTHGYLTLAIGDGANDVGMIQISDVGIGVYGREGNQAAQASDFAIPRFRFLKRLLAVHGHWCYYRFSNVALIMLYKCFLFTFVCVWFTFYTQSTPQSFYIDFYLSLFNLIFTVLPPAIFGVVEQDLPQDVLLENPELYKDPINIMKFKNLVWYFLLALYQSVIVFFGVTLNMGTEESLKANGMFAYISVCYIVVIQVVIWSKYHNIICWILYPLNIIMIPLIAIADLSSSNIQYKEIVESAMTKARTWMGLIIVIVAGILPYCILASLVNRFWPSKKRIYIERLELKKKKMISCYEASEMEELYDENEP